MKLELKINSIERVVTDQGTPMYAVVVDPFLLTTSEWLTLIAAEKNQRIKVVVDESTRD